MTGGCPQADRPTTRGTVIAGVPRRVRGSYTEGTEREAISRQQRSDARDESYQRPVSELGDTLCRPRRLCPAQRPRGWKNCRKLAFAAGLSRPTATRSVDGDTKETRKELSLRAGSIRPALLRQIPRLGPIRVALLIAFIQTPHRFRTKRQLWAYCGLALRDAEQWRIPLSPGANCSIRGNHPACGVSTTTIITI